MSTPSSTASPTPDSNPAPASPIVLPDAHPLSPWRKWTNFWFPKSDPTTLAFIRICTGLLVFYIHLAYSLDLQNFFGKQGWYALSFIDRERHEGPAYIPPFNAGWDDDFVVAQLPEFPHRRKAFMEFLRSLPENEAKRELSLKYLNRMNELSNADEFRLGLEYIRAMNNSKDMNNYLTVLTGGEIKTADQKEDLTKQYRVNTPSFLLTLPADERAAVAAEAGAFWTALAAVNWSDGNDGRNYVFNHFYEVSPPMRKALVEFINTLPKDAGERKKRLDFFEYWNSDPRKAYKQGSGIFSFWFHVTDPTQMALIHSFVLLVILLFTIGLFTRVTSVLVWIATVSYIHRTQQVLFGMDTMMNILLFYLMIGNSGAALSIDRLIARYRAARASLGRSGTIDGNTRAFLAYPPPSTNAGFGIRLIQVHFCFIYMAAGLSKLKGAAWWDGRAFWDVIANPEFTLMPYAWYEGTLRWIASIKPVYYIMIVSAVWTTLFVEIATPFLLWTRLRWFVILLATAMHAIIGVLMGLNLFELLMIIMLIAFFPDRVIRDRFRGGLDLVRMALTFNPKDQRQANAVALALASDIDNQIALHPDKDADAITVSTATGEHSAAGASAVDKLLGNLRLWQILGFALWIPGARAVLRKWLAADAGAKSSSIPFAPIGPVAKR